MKKIIILIVFFIALCAYGINKIESDVKKLGKSLQEIEISKILGINIKNLKIEEEYDSHGGFHGDGEYYAKINCTEVEKSIIESEWRKLPLSNTLNELLNTQLLSYNDYQDIDIYKDFINKINNMLQIENGYYCFYDRHSLAEDRKDESQIYNDARYSKNISIAIFDTDSNMLHYYELDT